MFMGIDLEWKCLKCGNVNYQNIGGCNLYSFDGGIKDYHYIETKCNKCHEIHLVTEAKKIDYIFQGKNKLINDYYHKAVVTKEYAEQHNIKKEGVCFY